MLPKHFRTMAAILVLTLSATLAFSQGFKRAGAFGGHGFGGMLGTDADYLELTDAQKAQMKDILTKEKPSIQPLMQQLRQSHLQMQQLEQAGGFDEAKVRAIATQQSQTMTEFTVQKARIKSELMTVLTPDQKDKLSKLQARRQARMQQHMQDSQGTPAAQ